MSKTYQKRKVPCKYCHIKIEVSRYAFEELNYVSGVCEECQTKIRNAPECDMCHKRLFQGCDECKKLNVTYHKFGDKLYHKSTEGYFDMHICEYHWDEYVKHLKAIVGVYEND